MFAIWLEERRGDSIKEGIMVLARLLTVSRRLARPAGSPRLFYSSRERKINLVTHSALTDTVENQSRFCKALTVSSLQNPSLIGLLPARLPVCLTACHNASPSDSPPVPGERGARHSPLSRLSLSLLCLHFHSVPSNRRLLNVF